jgi:hypothetical protein
MQTFTTAGVYNVQLRVTNTSGCFDTTSRNIEAYMVPLTNAGIDTMVCKGTGITLKATGALNYQWSPAAGLSCTTCANPITNPAQPSTYIVKGTTIHGCFSYDTIKVGMHYPFSMTFSKTDTLCKG